MRKILITLMFVLASMVYPPHSLAQTEITIDEMRIRIWPEYDQRSALVFYTGQVASEVSLPVELTFLLPEGVTINAAAYLDSQSGNLLLAETSQDGNQLTIVSPNGTFHIEFYDPSLFFNEDQRSYDLAFASSYPINKMLVEFQHPTDSTNVVTVPGNGTVGIDEVGLQATVVDLGSMPAESPVSFSMSYTKATDTLSVQVLDFATSGTPTPEFAPAPQPAASAPGLSPVWLGIGIGFVLLLVGGGVFAWRSGWIALRPVRQAKSRPQRRSAGSRFCTQCGTAVDQGDRFCRNCGASLRAT